MNAVERLTILENIVAQKRGRFISLAGKRFGYLTVLRRHGLVRKRLAWVCRCDCGREVIVLGIKLKQNRRKSCAIDGHKWRPPGQTGLVYRYKSEYASWQHMHARCSDPQNRRYARYGGRGIRVCERWTTFANFFADLGPKPTKGMSIHRLNNDGDYLPGNCRWATRAEQDRNTSKTVWVEWEGKRLPLRTVAEQCGLRPETLYARVVALKWPLARAINTPARIYERKRA